MDNRLKTPNVVTFRSILIGILLIPPNSYWIMQVEGVWNTGHSTCLSLMWHVVINLLVLILINIFLIKRFFPEWVFTQSEFITIYAMMALAGGIAGRDSFQILIPVMGWPFSFATPENEWKALFHHHLPSWLTIQDQETLKQFYKGESSLYTQKHFTFFLKPVLWWTAFVTVLGFGMICLNVLIRKQWTQNEKLSYPIIQLPFAITVNGGELKFFKRRSLWIGIAIGGGLDLVNGIHHFIPALPYFPVTYRDYNLGKFFTSPPWNAVGHLPFPLYPFVIGLGFFLPLDLAFSTWFFYLFRKGQQILSAVIGLKSMPGFPYLNQQSTGAWIGLFFVSIWLGRSHFKEVSSKILFNNREINDSIEPIKYRLAFCGFLFAFGFIVIFCYQAGMSFWVISPFFLIFFVLSIAITRVRAELGPPTHEIVGMNPSNMLVDVIGTRKIGNNNLSIFPLFWFFAGRGYRGHLMPHQLESFKMAEQAKMNTNFLPLAMMIAMIVGSLSGFWALIHLSFRDGLGVIPIGHDSGVFRLLATRIKHPTEGDFWATFFMGAGFVVTLWFTLLRVKFLWWPLHPAGYALSTNNGIDYIWSCILISSIIKWAVLNYGGIKAYRQAIPFFIGIILGEYVIGGMWSLLSVIIQKPTYDFYFA